MIYNQDNQGAAASRNFGLAAMSDDVEDLCFRRRRSVSTGKT